MPQNFISKSPAKRILGAVASVLMIMLPSPAIADTVLGIDEQFENRDDVSHQEIIDYLYERIAAPSTNPSAEQSGYSDAARSLYDAIFQPYAVKIPMRTVAEDGTVLVSATLYYSQGELFVQNDFESRENSSARNFATVDGNLYTWIEGEQTGIQLSRFTGDTVELVNYLVDWSAGMRSSYTHYLSDPEQFTVAQSDGITTLSYRETDFVESIRYLNNPLWMHALTIQFPICSVEPEDGEMCAESDRAIGTISTEVDYPIVIEEIPAAVKALPEGVTFEPSEWTANSFMGYL